jgi:hypothetical protein
MHNGVGPIPFPQPDANRCATCHNGRTAPATNANTAFDTSNHVEGTPSFSGLCIRCHTHEGAVLSNISGFTGDSVVLQNPAYGPPVVTTALTGFKCETCHEHGGGLRGVTGRDAAGNLVLYDPARNRSTNQFDLCTSCHNMYNYNQTKVIYSGTVASSTQSWVGSGPHTTTGTDWYRRIVSTHKEKGMSTLLTIPFANMTSAADASDTRITGYAVRLTNTNNDASFKGPCLDCHGHEAKTNTGSTAPTTNSTIHTDWAQSGHAGGLLTAKYNAGSATPTIPPTPPTLGRLDAVTQAYVDTTTNSWSHYNWDDTATRGDCQMCHTATGTSNYLVKQTTDLTGYSSAGNNFSHLIGWNATGGSKRQNELLYCWGCHKDAGTGSLRNTSQAILSFTFNDQPIVITNAGKSTACVVCHGGRGSAGEAAATDDRSSRFNGHHAPTAGFIYNEKTHIGYEYAGLSYTNSAFYKHDKISANAVGPCASCHMGPSGSTAQPSPSHSFLAVTESAGVITAITNQALCNTCHTPGGSSEMTPAILDEEKAAYAQASLVLNNWVNNVAGYTNYLGYPINGTNYNNQNPLQPVSNNAYGAYQNAKINLEEPCAYVHNRIYAKRLIFDSIDWMNNGVLNGTITIDVVTYPLAAAWLGADVTTGVATRP